MIWLVVARMASCTRFLGALVVFAVNANWNSVNDGWNVNANPVTNPNEWNADNQVISRN